MTLVGRSYSQRKSTPRHHGTPAPPLRDLSDDEYSEAMDADAEQGYALLHDLPALTGLDLESPGSTSLANPRRMGAGGRRDHNEGERAA